MIPGEREEDLEEPLKSLFKNIKFDKLGVLTLLARKRELLRNGMDEQIDEEIKEIRYHELMALQQQISKEQIKTG